MRALLLAGLLLGAVAQVHAQDDELMFDLFAGTLEVRNGQLELKRCDAGGTRYVLQDAPGSETVKQFIAQPPAGQVWVQAVAAYQALPRGRHGLLVREFAEQNPGSCHLGDMLEGFPAAQELKL